ncbi:MAG TPA: prolyl oligopeptidase family serine peptidase, partial [Terriglobales bacterium]|nr:prolyl oligopeptidase family serine peptidase [Terriglobales bacterium]
MAIAAAAMEAGGNPAARATGTQPAVPPKAKVAVVEDVLHGRKIADPYRWMENADSPETQAYVEAQIRYTRSLLDPLPGRDKIRARLTELLHIGDLDKPRVGGEYVFYTRREGTQNQPILYVRKGLSGPDRVLVDPNQLAADGTVALDWFFPSQDGKYLAYGTSPSGSERSTLHVIETESGKLLPERMPDTRFSSVAWKKDNSGFFYTRLPKKGTVPEGEENYNQRLYYHALGADPQKDLVIYGEGRNPQDIYQVSLSEDDRYLKITVFQGWTKSELYLKDLKSDAAPVAVATGKNFLYDGEVFKGTLYILTNEDTPRYHVLKAPADKPERANWKEVIPQTDAVLQTVNVFGGRLFAQYEKNASALVKVFSLDGKLLRDVPLPSIGRVEEPGGQPESRNAFFRFLSYTVPPTLYHHDLETGKTTQWAKVEAPIDPSLFEVKQGWYTSKDGTRVPMFIVSKKGLKLDGMNPTLLYGYGGFQVSMTPNFSRSGFLYLERGGVYAVANLRGGSEFGEDWHRAGMLEKKQNVFDDFIAAAEYLIAQKYTDREHLAIQGGSNGGLLVGAAITQRPELFRAALCHVPLLDMLRYQNFHIAKLWIPEYGSADDAKQFEWLFAYSP